MRRRTLLQTGLGLGLWAGSPAWALGRMPQAGLPWHERALLGLGTTLSLRVAHRDPALAQRALDAAVATIRHVESQMSLFDPHSALSRLNRDGLLRQPHPDLLRILHLAHTVSQRSQGAFDVTVQPLWQVFEAAHAEGRLPSRAAVQQARARVGWQAVALAPDGIRFEQPGMGITLNGIAQGYAADLVCRQLRQFGIEHALIDTGEWAPLGRPAPRQGWVLGVADPRDEGALIASLSLDGRCIATSADSQSTFSADYVNHHIFDPRSGYSPPELASVTVAAPSCALADALTKVMFVAGMRRALTLARCWRVDVLLVDKAGHWQASAGLKLLRA